MKISIVIPHFNGLEIFEKTFPHVLRAAEFYRNQSRASSEIIIVDDGSDSEILAKLQTVLEKLAPDKITITFIMHKLNKGFSSAVNTGVKKAKGEIILLLNTDVTPEEDFIFPLIKHFTHEDVFAVGCLEKSKENNTEILRGRGIGIWKRGFLVHKRGDVDNSSTLWVSGGSGAFRISLWKKLGGMNEIYNPFYWEDIDLSYRAQKAGLRVLFEKESIVTHEHEKGTIRKSRSQREINQIAYRNQFIFVWINAGVREVIFHKLWLPYHMVKALSRGDSAFFSGLFQALQLVPKILQLRRRVKRMSKCTDQEITRQFLAEYNE